MFVYTLDANKIHYYLDAFALTLYLRTIVFIY